MPLITPLVAAGVSMGVAVGVTACKVLFAMLNPSAKVPWLVRKPMAAASALIAALGGTLAGLSTTYLPVYVALPALLRSGVSQPAAIAAMLLLLLVPPMILPPCKPAEVRADLLLYFIVLWHHGYLLAWPAHLNSGVANGAIGPDLYLCVALASALSLATHARATLHDTMAPPSRTRSSSGGSGGGSTGSSGSSSARRSKEGGHHSSREKASSSSASGSSGKHASSSASSAASSSSGASKSKHE